MVRRQKTGNFLCTNFYKTETMAVERRREEDWQENYTLLIHCQNKSTLALTAIFCKQCYVKDPGFQEHLIQISPSSSSSWSSVSPPPPNKSSLFRVTQGPVIPLTGRVLNQVHSLYQISSKLDLLFQKWNMHMRVRAHTHAHVTSQLHSHSGCIK